MHDLDEERSIRIWRIKRTMALCGLKQNQTAKLIKMKTSTFSKIMTGRCKNITLERLDEIVQKIIDL